MKKLRITIDDGERRKNFIIAMKKFFREELKGETFKVAIKECDLVEFAFKGNGSVRFNKTHILADD